MKPNTPGHRVLVQPDSLHDFDPVFKSAKSTGIVIAQPTERKEATGVDTGIVVQVGPSAFHGFGDSTPWCKVGDKISYVRHGGKFVCNPDNKEQSWLVINDEDVVMVWEKDND